MAGRPDRSALPPTPAFAEFYRAINGRDPFPWQSRLAAQVADTERWPAEVGVPTGLGKTACLDIAVWWLASQAHRRPVKRTAPTRIWWLVNRRLLVDSTTEHAEIDQPCTRRSRGFRAERHIGRGGRGGHGSLALTGRRSGFSTA